MEKPSETKDSSAKLNALNPEAKDWKPDENTVSKDGVDNSSTLIYASPSHNDVTSLDYLANMQRLQHQQNNHIQELLKQQRTNNGANLAPTGSP